MGTIENNFTVPTYVKQQPAIKGSSMRPKRASKTHLLSNAWRLIDSEFDKLNVLFSFSIEACCDPKGKNRHGMLPLCSERDSFLSHEVLGQSVFCKPPWSLVVQNVWNTYASAMLSLLQILKH